MTVAEYIELLKEFPQHAEIKRLNYEYLGGAAVHDSIEAGTDTTPYLYVENGRFSHVLI